MSWNAICGSYSCLHRRHDFVVCFRRNDNVSAFHAASADCFLSLAMSAAVRSHSSHLSSAKMHEALDQLPVPSGIERREHCDREQLQSMAYHHTKILLSFNSMCKLCRKMLSIEDFQPLLDKLSVVRINSKKLKKIRLGEMALA